MKYLINMNYTLLFAGVCMMALFVGGCTGQETPLIEDTPLPITVRIPVRAFDLQDGDVIENVRLLISKTKDGNFFYNKEMEDVIEALELQPGLYDIVAIANADIYKQTLDKEQLTITDLMTLKVSPEDFVSSEDIICEQDLFPFPRTTYLKGVRIGNILDNNPSNQISIDGGNTWQSDLPIELEHIFPKLNISIRKITENLKDRIRITSLNLSGIPRWSFLLPSSYNGNESATLEWFRSETMDNYLEQNNDYRQYGKKNIIIPEHLLTNDPVYTLLAVTYDYESWNEEKEIWNPPFENVIAQIPFSRDLLRNNDYQIGLTITQIGEFEFAPYLTLLTAGWDEAGNSYYNAGNKGVTVEGEWTQGIPDENGNLYIDMNESVEYSFTFNRELPEDTSPIHWKIVLTNPVNFKIEGTGEGYTHPGENCCFRITPDAYSSENHSTKVYINIANGAGGTKQLPIDPENKYVLYQNPQ